MRALFYAREIPLIYVWLCHGVRQEREHGHSGLWKITQGAPEISNASALKIGLVSRQLSPQKVFAR